MGYCGSYLPVNGYLSTWDYITSNNDLYTLVMQSDGNLCVYLEAVPTFGTPLIWQSGPTAGGGKFHAIVENGGSLSVYAGADPQNRGPQVWTSGSSATGGQFFLSMQPTGNLSLFAGQDPRAPGALVWDAGPVPSPDPPPPLLSATKKLQQLVCFAPTVWLAVNEEYFPCSTDWSFQFLTRYANADEGGKYCLKTILPLQSPSDDSLPSFAGHLADARVYAFWVEKAGGFHDLIYFVYFGYDRGKPALNTIWGSHVGDWEHLTVRLDSNLLPTQVYLSQHADGEVAGWWNMEKAGGAGNSPVLYCAWGSHGLYKESGAHKYGPGKLFNDACSQGSQWETAGALETFDYDARSGLGTSSWPRWMDTDYTTPGSAPQSPSGNTVYRWGNPKQGREAFGESQLNDGPTGPPDKGACWDPNVFG